VGKPERIETYFSHEPNKFAERAWGYQVARAAANTTMADHSAVVSLAHGDS